MNSPIAAKQAVELDAIQTDALFVCRLAKSFERNSGRYGIAAAFGAYSYLSLFLYESHKYLTAKNSSIANMLAKPSQAELERSRHSVKLFDDNKKSIQDVIDYFTQTIGAEHSRSFLGNTWLPLVRPLESDLGFYIYRGKIVVTTHGVTFGLGVEPKVLLGQGGEQYIGTIAHSYGKYFGSFWDGTTLLGPSFVDKMAARQIRTKDVRASRYYPKHFNGRQTPGLNALLATFQASLNFLDTMLALDDLAESRQTILKMKFVTLYHVVSSLQSLRQTHASDLSQESVRAIGSIVGDPGLIPLTQGSSKKFRNTLVHYGLAFDVQPSDLIPTVPFYGLVEKYFPGYDYARLHAEVTEQVVKAARAFNEWS